MSDLQVTFGADLDGLNAGSDEAADKIKATSDNIQAAFADLANRVTQSLTTITDRMGSAGQVAQGQGGGAFAEFARSTSERYTMMAATVGVAMALISSSTIEAQQSLSAAGSQIAHVFDDVGSAAAAAARDGERSLGEWADRGVEASASIGASMDGILTKIGRAVVNTAANVAGDEFAKLSQSAIDFAAALKNQADATGVSAASLGALHAAEIDLGLTSGSLTTAYINLKDALDGTGTGATKARATLEAMGISLDDLDGKDTAKVLQQMADKFAAYDDASKRAALSNAVFGAGVGTQVLPAMIQGSSVLRAYMQEAERLTSVTNANAEQAARIKAIQAADAAEQLSAIAKAKAAYIGLTDALKEFGKTDQGVWNDAKNVAREGAATIGAQFDQAVAKLRGLVGMGPEPAVNRALKASGGNKPEKQETPDVPATDNDGAALWKAQLQDKEIAEGKFFADSKQAELKYWQEKRDDAEKGSKDWIAATSQVYALSRAIEEDALAKHKADLSTEQEANRKSLETRLALEQQKAQLVRDTYGAESKEAAEAARAVMAAQQELADQNKRLAEDRLATNEKVSEALVQDEEQTLKNRLAVGDVTARQVAAREIQLENEIYQIRLAGLQKKAELEAADVEQHRKALNEIEVLEAQHNVKLQQLRGQQTEAVKAQYDKMLSPISSAIGTSVNSVIAGTQTSRQAVANMGQSIIASYVSMAAQSAEKWLAGELAKTAATEAGAATRTATEQAAAAEGKAAGAASGFTQIMQNAYKSASGAYSAVVGIPYVGPVLAPIAAAAAFAAVAAFGGSIASAAGGYEVPHDMLAYVHKDEKILPARFSAGLERLVNGDGGGGGHTIVFAPQVSAVDARGVRQFFDQYQGDMAAQLATTFRNGNSDLRGKA